MCLIKSIGIFIQKEDSSSKAIFYFVTLHNILKLPPMAFPTLKQVFKSPIIVIFNIGTSIDDKLTRR